MSGVGKIVDFRHLSRRIFETAQYRAQVASLLITNRNTYIKRFRLVQMTLDDL